MSPIGDGNVFISPNVEHSSCTGCGGNVLSAPGEAPAICPTGDAGYLETQGD